MRKLALGLVLVAVLMSCSCASIVSKSSYPVSIISNPSGATVTVKNKKSIDMHRATTPTTITLSAKSGYFSPADYSFLFEKDGFYPSSSSLSAGMDGWYVGNVLLGGLIGILIVDPLTGAMWKLDDTVVGNLSPMPGFREPTRYIGSTYREEEFEFDEDIDFLIAVLRRRPHSFRWLRRKTRLDYSDREFKRIVRGHPDLFRLVGIRVRGIDEQGDETVSKELGMKYVGQ